MRYFIILFLWIMNGSFLTLPAVPALAGTFEVAPTTITLTPETKNASLYITNRSEEPVYIQIEAMDWKQSQKGDELTPSTALMVNPPMAELPPGRKQTIRLAVTPDAVTDGKERTFRLLVSELQNNAITGKEGVNMLLQFSVPLFVSPPKKNPPLFGWSIEEQEGSIMLIARNGGTRHAKLSAVKMTPANGREIDISKDAFKYILAGSAGYWKTGLTNVTAGEKYLVTAKEETDGKLRATIVIPP